MLSKANSNLFHGFFFAVTVIVMVYGGEQVKVKSDGYAAALFRVSTVAASAGIVSLGLSFLLASASEIRGEQRQALKSDIEGNYSYQGGPLDRIDREHVKQIQKKSEVAGAIASLQDRAHRQNSFLTYVSLGLLILSVLSFAIGVCLL